MTITARAIALRERAKLFAHPDTIKFMQAELCNARTRFPTNTNLLRRARVQFQFIEETLLQHDVHGNVEIEVTEACIVMLCLIVRLCEEGDSDYKYRGLKNVALLETALDEFYKEVTAGPSSNAG